MSTRFSTLREVPGVTAVMFCEAGGIPASAVDREAFPVGTEEAMADLLAAMEIETGPVGSANVAFDGGRLIMKKIGHGFIGIRCDGNVNMKMLDLSLALALKKMEARPVAAQKMLLEQPEEKGEDSRILLEVLILEKTAGTFWDSMTESVSVTQTTAIEISNACNTGGFKKLRITNRSTGNRKSFPVHTVRAKNDERYNSKIIMTMAAAEALGVAQGESVVAEPAVGDGIFGWEGI